jgi:hypothetical protein
MFRNGSKPLLPALTLVLILVGCNIKIGSGPGGTQRGTGDGEGGADPAENAAAAAVKKLGGQVTRDNTQPAKPVTEVSLHHTKTTDADLKDLAALSQLRKLKLSSTQVTGVGLKDLAGNFSKSVGGAAAQAWVVRRISICLLRYPTSRKPSAPHGSSTFSI